MDPEAARKTLKRALELAVATEELGAEYYRHMAARFRGQSVGEVFTRLARDEANHEAQFKKLLAEVDDAPAPAPDDEAYFLVRAAALSEFFDRDAVDDLESIETPAVALTRALAFEKSTLFFYQSVREAIGASPQLDALVAEEKSHVTALTRVMVSDAAFRGIADPW